MKFRVFLAVTACKISRRLLRIMGKGATNLPGRVALKIYPNLLGYLAKDVKTIIVTGTNGKTTTSRMIEKTLIDSNVSFFANKSGANLLNGITAEYVANSNFFGKNKCEYALIESDEAALKAVSKFVDAKCILVTNIFRDQLDRFGETTVTLNNIKIGIENSKNAVLCLNADCSMTVSLADNIPNKVLFFGVNKPIYKERANEISDALYCIKCKGKYTYEYITFGHLGKFKCDSCGYERPNPDIAVTDILKSNAEYSQIEIDVAGKKYQATINLPGGYNIYNGLSSVAVSHVLGLSDSIATEALSEFECGFGRMEKFDLGKSQVRMILVKNPAGCNQVLNFLGNIDEESIFVICLNDKIADGKDISWIWDVDFELLKKIEDKLPKIIISGIRADDMAMRLKYADISLDKIEIIKDYNLLIDKISKQDKQVYIMPTYTAMLDIRAILSKKFGYKNFWE